MAPAEQQSFAARTDALPQVRAFVQERCARMALHDGTIQRLHLIVEELFINCVIHGYGGDSAARVALALRDAGAELELTVEDSAPAFDPFARLPIDAKAADPRSRPIGGQGLVLIARMTARRRYERRGGCNRTTVAVLKNSSGMQKKLPTEE